MPRFSPRRSPPHARPEWVDEGDPLFLTFACATRGADQLANRETWEALMAANQILSELGKWQPLVILVMPDHVHAMARVPRAHSAAKVVGALKRSITRVSGVDWQRGFFDHRPRTDDARQACKDYILMNPVRKGICATPDEWPYIWIKSAGNG